MNNTTAISGIFTATKGTPGNPGSSYLKLTSQTIGPVVVNGVAVSGVLDSITLLPMSGFPFSQRPQNFKGSWQHMIFGSSQGSVSVILSRWISSSGTREIVATANQTLSGMAMSWANFTINFIYQTGNNPDSCIIILKASGAVPAQDDYLWIDNLSFSGSVAGIEEKKENDFSIISFPNPANNEIEFIYSNPIQQGDRLMIYDVPGNFVLEKTINENTFKINTAEFANGTYIYTLINKYNVQYTTGKFTIQH